MRRADCSPLSTIRSWIASPGDAVQWACVLEATAPKVGNVFPGRRFADLSHSDFMVAAEIASRELTDPSHSVGRRVLNTVKQTRAATHTNVNLGIALLLAPLVAADQRLEKQGCSGNATTEDWLVAMDLVLGTLTAEDACSISAAIAGAGAGGLGTVDEMDVSTTDETPTDLIVAMRAAADRDRVALQYSEGFRDLFENVIPVLEFEIHEQQDTLAGIAQGHLRLLGGQPDSLIARKNGSEAAIEVSRQVSEIDRAENAAILELDRQLRKSGNSFNPGTTADLIAAALYVLLRKESREQAL